MKAITKKECLYFVIFLASILSLVYILVTHLEEGKIYLFSYDKGIFLIIAILAVTSLILFLLERLELHKKKGFFSAKVNLIKVFFVISSVASLSFLGGFLYAYYLYQPEGENWSIGIYTSTSSEPVNFTGEHIDNPVLTKDDITDVQASSVADPFLIYDNGTYYMFFEVLNSKTNKGEIGLATCSDGFNWSYQKIVLKNTYHLSYPCVFKWNNEYYMIQNHDITTVVLYKAHDFPYSWTFEKTLLKGENFQDNTIFNYNNTWWLYSQTRLYDVLRLYYSDTPFGPWTEHPKSPIIEGDANIARPGGNVVVFDNRIIRFTQDDEPYYGNQVWAFEITELSRSVYEEEMVGNQPVLKGYDNWNSRGMHHISPYRINENEWIACVDGK